MGLSRHNNMKNQEASEITLTKVQSQLGGSCSNSRLRSIWLQEENESYLQLNPTLISKSLSLIQKTTIKSSLVGAHMRTHTQNSSLRL